MHNANYKHALTRCIVLTLCVAAFSCSKPTLSARYPLFCSALYSDDHEFAIEWLNDFLRSKDGEDINDQFESLELFLESQSCIDSSRLLSGIIKTYPPQREIAIFQPNGFYVLDVRFEDSTNQLTALRFHQ